MLHSGRSVPAYLAALLLILLLLPDEPAAAQEGARIRVRSTPVGEVYINGTSIGRTPAMFIASRTSEFEVEIRAEGYVPWCRRMKAGDLPEVVSALLDPGEGTVRLRNLPTGTLLRLDGRTLEDPASGFRVVGPAQTLRVRLPNGRLVRQKIAPLHAREREMVLVRRWQGGILARSLLVPGWGQAYDGHRLEGAVFFLAAAGTAALLVHADRTFTQSVTAYREARTAYEHAVIESEIVRLREEMLKRHAVALQKNDRREIALSVFAGTYAANLLGTLFLHTVGYRFAPTSQQPASGLRMSGSASGGTVSVGATVTL